MKENQNKPSQEYLESLPLLRLKVGGVMRAVRYDAAAEVAYLLDDEGKPTYRKAPYKPSRKEGVPAEPLPQPPVEMTEIPADAPEADKESVNVSEDFEIDLDSVELEGEPEEKRKLPWLWIALGVGVLAAVVFLAIFLGNRPEDKNPPVETTTAATTVSTTTAATEPEETEPSTVSTEPVETEPVITYSILATTKMLLPGHIIAEGDLAAVKVSEELYMTLSAMQGYYIEADLDMLYGYQTCICIPQGQYLGYDDICLEYRTVNPWLTVEGRDSTVIFAMDVSPETLMNHLWGNCTDLTIVTQTKVTVPTEEDPADPEQETKPPVNGVEQSSSVMESMIIETYVVKSVVVADLLDADGNSLYAEYEALASIPAVYQEGYLTSLYTSSEELRDLIPYQVVFAVTAEQAQLLAGISPDNMTVTMGEPEIEIQNSVQQESYAKISNVAQRICAVMERLLEKEALAANA